jgi:hypothetical protein
MIARVGRLAATCSASTARQVSTQRGSVRLSRVDPRPLALRNNPAGPSLVNAITQRRTVMTLTPSSSAFAW